VDSETIRKTTPQEARKYARAFRTINPKQSPRRYVNTGAQLADLRDGLAIRLEKGYEWCQAHPEDMDSEDFWIELLEAYQDVCDALDESTDTRWRDRALHYIFEGEEVIEDAEQDNG
jgi:hypothetical protein